ncbi:MAG: BrnT family toxin [Spirochaetaceae bacterium]|jgi:uncharacterized DUF497 family protein|nr:BrnT family toxin [Spirochaetaceae bacterium]
MTVISSDGRFEWDLEKDTINIKKHGLSFEKTKFVFDDTYFLEMFDESHSQENEDRFVGIGCIDGLIVISVFFVERERIRLISSRKATLKEEVLYNEWRQHLNT